MFFMVAALTTVAAAGPAGNVQPARERVRRATGDQPLRGPSAVAEAL